MMTVSGSLILIPAPLVPAPLGAPDAPWLLPQDAARVQALTHFVVEAPKTARAHLKALDVATPLRELHLATLNEHTAAEDVLGLLAPLLAGHDVGLMSEAGCPGVADPGAALVALAHRHHIKVEPLIGPSSLLLALMASGANGQNFAFAGYLPTDAHERLSALKRLESDARQHNRSWLFIETPYRNDRILEDIRQLQDDTWVCAAVDLTLPTQAITSQSARAWRATELSLHKRPAVFVLWTPAFQAA